MVESHISTYLLDAREVDQMTWNDVRFIARAACTQAILGQENTPAVGIPRTQDEVDAFVGWNDHADYFKYMADPNVLVGTRLRPNQQYWNARLGLVSVFGELAGYIYAADNTSSSHKSIRHIKHHINPTNHLWIRSIGVLPTYQNNDKLRLGSILSKSLLLDAPSKQPVSAYVLPDDFTGIRETLLRHNFQENETSVAHPFGPNTRPSRMIRMTARSVKSVLETL